MDLAGPTEIGSGRGIVRLLLRTSGRRVATACSSHWPFSRFDLAFYQLSVDRFRNRTRYAMEAALRELPGACHSPPAEKENHLEDERSAYQRAEDTYSHPADTARPRPRTAVRCA